MSEIPLADLINARVASTQRQRAYESISRIEASMTPEGRALYEKDKAACGISCEHYINPPNPWKSMNPQDPNGLPQHAPGAKNDAGKQYSSLLLNFSRALSAVAQVATMGADKYSRGGWQHVPDGITRYRDAEWRHLLKGQVEECDPESGLPHSWHKLWNCLAVLELELREEELRQQKQP
jgi:hypothetical protein